MEFKKIDDNRFQCLLYEEDLEENDITLDDFFKNDTDKIHNLLDVIMERAKEDIGVELSKGIMSLSLAPQPDRSILLTVSSGDSDWPDVFKHAKEKIDRIIAKNKHKNDESNIIKGDYEGLGEPGFESFDEDNIKDSKREVLANEKSRNKPGKGNLMKSPQTIFKIKTFEDFEKLCNQSAKTWGISNQLYKDDNMGVYYLCVQRGRGSEEKYKTLLTLIMEFGEFDSTKVERMAWINEHCTCIIKTNAINTVRKYLL